MSSRARILLASGTTAQRSATLAQASAQAITEGCTVLTVAPAAVPEVLALALRRGVAGLLPSADSLPDDVWAALPGVGELAAVLAMCEAAAEGQVVVVDIGDLAAARRLVGAPELALRVLDCLLTPEAAMARLEAAGSPFEALADLRRALMRALRVLREDAVVRVAAGVEPATVDAVRAFDAALTVQGLSIDGVIVMREPGQRAASEAMVARLEESGCAAWATGRRRRAAPPGAAVTDLLSRPRGMRVDDLHVLREDGLLVAVVPIPVERIGIDGEQLVLGVGGMLRWVPLPAALRRCTVQGARRWRGTVEVVFRPDDERWRPAS